LLINLFKQVYRIDTVWNLKGGDLVKDETHPGVYYVDAVVAILILIAGVLVVIIGVDVIREIGNMGFYGTPVYVTASEYLIVVVGIASIVYGAKRMIDDVIKTL
jgi:hypothetical protein